MEAVIFKDPLIEYNGDIINVFLSNFKKESKSFFKRINENPLIYRERKLTSIIFPALYKISPNIILEEDFYKTKNNKKSNRKLDIYFADKEMETVFLIELKQAWDTYRKDKMDKHTIDKWSDLKKQLKDLTPKAVKEHIDDHNEKKIYKLGLYFMPTLFNSESDDEINQNLQNYFSKKKFKLFKDCDFRWYWKIPQEFNVDTQGEYSIAYYSIFGKIDKISK